MGQHKDANEEAHEQIEDAFSTLRDWVESGNMSGPSIGPSSRPSFDSSLSDYSEEEVELRGQHEAMNSPHGGCPGLESWGSNTTACDSSDAFFTPMQPAPTPRPGRVMHLLFP